jgi:hypothetical protein
LSSGRPLIEPIRQQAVNADGGKQSPGAVPG